MDAARKAELSRKGKERWANSKTIAERLGRKTEAVHNAYSRLKAAGLLEQLLGDAWAASSQRALELIDAGTTIKVHHPKSMEELTTREQIKVTAWYIDKIGDAAKALKLVKLIGKLTEELES